MGNRYFLEHGVYRRYMANIKESPLPWAPVPALSGTR